MSMSAPSAELTSNWKFFIPLGHGKKAIVDEIDVMFLLGVGEWCCGSGGYARRAASSANGVRWMHRLVAERCGLDLNGDIDHINRDKLDNRRCNLRSAIRSQNQVNSITVRGSSKVRGVTVRKGGFEARIGVDGEVICLGTYATVERALEVYRLAAIRYYGEFANG